MDIEVAGADKLAKLSTLLRQRGDRLMSRDVTTSLAQPLKRIKEHIKGSTDRFLPRRGGLADSVSRTRITHRIRKGRNPRITIEAKPNRVKDPLRMDRGRIAHWTFGRRPLVFQNVTPGWFSVPAEESAPWVRQEVVRAVDGWIDQLERDVRRIA